jgi:hypothetical protein
VGGGKESVRGGRTRRGGVVMSGFVVVLLSRRLSFFVRVSCRERCSLFDPGAIFPCLYLRDRCLKGWVIRLWGMCRFLRSVTLSWSEEKSCCCCLRKGVVDLKKGVVVV